MPCRCDGAEKSSLKNLVDNVHKLTRVACDMRTILRREGLEKELTNETKQWIAIHDEEDARRIHQENINGERERVRLTALEKLSLEERRVLGL